MPANRPHRADIERKAIETYGEAAQIDMAIEECSELIKALLKRRRYQSAKLVQDCVCRALDHDIQNEVADVQIMLDQLKMIFGPTLIEEDAKLTRLADRLGMMEVDNADKTR